MSVQITEYSTTPWQYVHDERGHGGDFDPATLGWGTNIDGTEDRNVCVVPCPHPDCGSVSYWPAESFPPLMAEVLQL